MWLARVRFVIIVYLLQSKHFQKAVHSYRSIVGPFVSILERKRGIRVLSSRVLTEAEVLEWELQNELRGTPRK
jgi:hypothetical protein